MNETVITWTIANWITVFLMVFSVALVMGLGLRVYSSMKQGTGEQ